MVKKVLNRLPSISLHGCNDFFVSETVFRKDENLP